MLAPSGDLLRAGLGLKLDRVKRATRSYVRDRAEQARGTATSYAVATGLFAAAGVFVLAACLVGLTALFRWVEMTWGLFPAFGVLGGVLLTAAIICAALASLRLKRRPPDFPSLASRLRVAILAPAFAGRAPAEDAARPAIDPSSEPDRAPRRPITSATAAGDRNLRLAVITGAMLLGAILVRRQRTQRAKRDQHDA